MILVGAKAEQRMQEIMYPMPDSIDDRLKPRMGYRKKIANQIADAVTKVYPYMSEHIDWDPAFAHKMEKTELSRRLISMEDVNEALKEAEGYRKEYEKMLKELNDNPSLKEKPRWYRDITVLYCYKKSMKCKERMIREVSAQTADRNTCCANRILSLQTILLNYTLTCQRSKHGVRNPDIPIHCRGDILPTVRS